MVRVRVVVKVRGKVRETVTVNTTLALNHKPNPPNQTVETGRCPEQRKKKYAGGSWM